jgi:hypothetical protein
MLSSFFQKFNIWPRQDVPLGASAAVSSDNREILRPRHFDVGVCVIPKNKLEIFGEKEFPD